MTTPSDEDLENWRQFYAQLDDDAPGSLGPVVVQLCDALLALRSTGRDVLGDYFGNVADGGESPSRPILRSLAAQCDVDFEQWM